MHHQWRHRFHESHGGDGVSVVDFSEHGSIIVHKNIVDGGLMQFIPDDGKQSTARQMHKMLLAWGKDNDRDIGIMVTSKEEWPTPCAIVFPKEMKE
jgi:hypothetical protein